MLKIQDGCDSFCSYCVVPHVRGKSRSLPAGLVQAQVGQLIDAGYLEIVLTGIHLGKRGKDLDPPLSLSHLLEKIASGGARHASGSVRWSQRNLDPICST